MTVTEPGVYVGTYDSVIIDKEVGDGTVTLKGVVINGDLNINGGGSHSVIVSDCKIGGNVIAAKEGGETLRVYLDGSDVSSFEAKCDIILESKGGSFGSVVSSGNTMTVQGTDTKVGDLIFNGGFLSISSGSMVSAMHASGEIGVKTEDGTIGSIVATGDLFVTGDLGNVPIFSTSSTKLLVKVNGDEVHVHTLVEVAAVDPTCLIDGSKAHYECSGCHSLFVKSEDVYSDVTTDDLKVAALGHEYIFVDRMEPTAALTGMEEHYKCSRCSSLFVLRDEAYSGISESELVIPKIETKYLVQFLDGNGALIFSAEYPAGTASSEIEVPESAVKDEDQSSYYLFLGWDKEITDVISDATYNAVFVKVPSGKDNQQLQEAWNYFSEMEKTGKLVTWYGYTDSATATGGFETVTDSSGTGAILVSSIYYADRSSAAIALMIIDAVMDSASEYRDIFDSYGVGDVVKYITDASAARDYMSNDITTFSVYNTSVKDESLPYLVGVHYLTSRLSESKIVNLYNTIKAATSSSISYIELDGSMIPTYYGDGSISNAMVSLGDYALSTKFDIPYDFYSVTSTTETYVNYGYYSQYYYTYNNTMYNTFLWNALIGVTPSDYSCSSSLDLLSNLSNSDGTYKATPCATLDHFKVSYWHVKYRADENSSWVDMDANAAVAKQNAEGGYINYLASVIVLEYTDDKATVSGTVTVGGEAASDIKVAVFEKLTRSDAGYDSKGVVSYVQRSTTYTDSEGKYTVSVPTSSNYLVRYYVGSTTVRDGTVVKTLDSSTDTIGDVSIDAASVSGKIVDSKGNALSNDGLTLVFTPSKGTSMQTSVNSDGTFSVASLAPNSYTVAVYTQDGASVASTTLSIVGNMTDLLISASACATDITVKDIFGNVVKDVTVTLMDPFYGTFTSVTDSEGVASFSVVAGTYKAYVDNAAYDDIDKYVSVATKTVTASSSSTASAELTVASSASTSSGIQMALGYYSTSAHAPVFDSTYVMTYTGTDATAVNGKLTVNGTAVVGTVAYIMSDGKAYAFSTDSDGKFTGNVAAGDYTVYATDNSGNAYFGKVTAGTDAVEFKLVTAYAVTAKVSCTAVSSVGFAHVPVKFTVTHDSDSYVFYAYTGDAGSFAAYIPKDYSVACDLSKDSVNALSDKLAVTEDFAQKSETSITAAKTLTFYVTASMLAPIATSDITVTSDDSSYSTGTGYLKLAYGSTTYYAVVQNGNITKAYSDSAKTTEVNSLVPGRYTVTYDGDDQYVTSSTVSIYPTACTFDVTAMTGVTKISITKGESTDVVTLVALDDGKFENSGTNYYIVSSEQYYFKIVNSDSTKVAYVPVTTETAYTYTLADAVTLKGYIGATVTGDIYMDFGTKIKETVTDGEFSVLLPKDVTVTSLSVKATASDDDYEYTVSEVFSVSLSMSEDKTYNVMADVTRADNDKYIEFVSGSGYHLSDGAGTLDLKIHNVNDYAVTYYIEGNGAFVLDQVYVVTIPAKGDVTQTVSGHYNELTVGAGNTNATVSIVGTDGTSVATKVIPASYYADDTTGSKITVKYADEETVYDAADGHSYRYAVVISSTYAAAKSVTLSAAFKDASTTGWVIGYINSDGYAIGPSFTVDGLGDTTLYVVLTNQNGDSTSAVPSVTITVSGDCSDTYDASPVSGLMSSVGSRICVKDKAVNEPDESSDCSVIQEIYDLTGSKSVSSDGMSAEIQLSDYSVSPASKVTATLSFSYDETSMFSSGRYSAQLLDSSGFFCSGALSKTSGSFSTADFNETLFITLPAESGLYELQVVFIVYSSDRMFPFEITVAKKIGVCEPMEIHFDLKAVNMDLDGEIVYLTVDGERVYGSEQRISVLHGQLVPVEFRYYCPELAEGAHEFGIESNGVLITGDSKNIEFNLANEHVGVDESKTIIARGVARIDLGTLVPVDCYFVLIDDDDLESSSIFDEAHSIESELLRTRLKEKDAIPEETVQYGDTITYEYVGSVYGYYDEKTDSVVPIIIGTNIESVAKNTDNVFSEDLKSNTFSAASLTIGSKTTVGTFEEQLIGHKVGDTVQVKIAAGEGYKGADTNEKVALAYLVTTMSNLSPMTQSEFDTAFGFDSSYTINGLVSLQYMFDSGDVLNYTAIKGSDGLIHVTLDSSDKEYKVYSNSIGTVTLKCASGTWSIALSDVKNISGATVQDVQVIEMISLSLFGQTLNFMAYDGTNVVVNSDPTSSIAYLNGMALYFVVKIVSKE